MALVLAALASLALRGGAPAPPQEAPDKKLERIILPREKRSLLFMELTLASPEPATPMLVLFHEARSSKGEYRPMVPRLKALGYNCLAVDLSSGDECRGVKNATARRASRSPTYLDAFPDVHDALAWAREKHAHGKLVAWGSSYSASLALHAAAEHPDLVDGVIAFSPGEYFERLGKSATWVQETAQRVACPVFVTSARGEKADWEAIFAAIPAPEKTSFLPQSSGAHGSRALWPESAGNEEYWVALEAFLRRHFPVPSPPAVEAGAGGEGDENDEGEGD